MLLLTKTFFWLPLYVALIYLVFKKFKIEGWMILIGAALTVTLCDQITGFMKIYFQRLRPSQEPSLQGLIHLVNGYKGGLYGFASGHAANTFGISVFIWLTLKEHYRWIVFIFAWAVLMTYTRIYLGVHYPGDIITGALIGMLCGWVGFRFSTWLRKRYEHKLKPKK
jgi:undecaprenyl-diphosphatase